MFYKRGFNHEAELLCLKRPLTFKYPARPFGNLFVNGSLVVCRQANFKVLVARKLSPSFHWEVLAFWQLSGLVMCVLETEFNAERFKNLFKFGVRCIY